MKLTGKINFFIIKYMGVNDFITNIRKENNKLGELVLILYGRGILSDVDVKQIAQA